MNDTTFQGNGKIAYVPVVVNTKLSKLSNADRIRAMTDEELAKYMRQWDRCPAFSLNCQEDCEKCWLDWLQQEVNNNSTT